VDIGARAVEALVTAELRERYDGCRALVTGHTGFKGSWLALWLDELGATVTGVALPRSTTPNHWDLLELQIAADHRVDIRQTEVLANIVADAKPNIVFHLAAQSLVRRSYGDPLETWSTNVGGTASVLEACRLAGGVSAIVVVTSDKCYDNRGAGRRYRECDPLGGHDPYSASKAAAEMVAASYRDAYFSTPGSALVATARAGNVIGGGDWAEDRLIPDLVRARVADQSLAVRSPAATRPWQHVLECANGYLQLGARLLERRLEFAAAWNFGPESADERTVRDVLTILHNHWPGLRWREATSASLAEAQWLALDSSKAQARLGWRSIWSLDDALAKTAQWYRRFLADGVVESRAQLGEYIAALDTQHAVAASQ